MSRDAQVFSPIPGIHWHEPDDIWKVWLKGPYYEAIRIRTWAELEAMRSLLNNAWSTKLLFLQSHVTGYEESIALSACKGELLHCVFMRKRDLTNIAKTWMATSVQCQTVS